MTRPELGGAALDAELDRLAEVYPEYTADEFVPRADRRGPQVAAWGEPNPVYGEMPGEYDRARADREAGG